MWYDIKSEEKKRIEELRLWSVRVYVHDSTPSKRKLGLGSGMNLAWDSTLGGGDPAF